MGISSKLAKVKSQGFARTLEIQFNRFVPPWIFRYSKGDIYDLDIERLRSSGNNIDDPSLIVRCFSADADANLRLRLREFTWNSVPIETTKNDLGYVIVDREDPEKFLGGLWAGLGSFSEHNLGVEFQFKDHQAWLYCAFVHADSRGRGVYKRLISYVANDLQQRGYSQLLGIVQPWNRISRLMHEKNSRGVCGRMSATRIGPFVWVSHRGNISVDKRLVTNPGRNPARVSIQGESSYSN